MISAVLGTGALACVVLAGLLLRSVGPNYRIARLLAGTPQVELSDAIELAGSDRPRYVRVTGRVSSDEEFPDEHDRPLVYRRTRVEIGDGRGNWDGLTEDTEAVPFGVEARTAFVGVDAAALAEGLVVVPREAVGHVRDLGPELVEGRDLDAPSRLVVEQISAVEHAFVAGVPRLDSDGNPWMTAGLGRPLVLTTVEVPAAMRLLARGRRATLVAATILFGAGIVLAVAAALTFVVTR